MYTNRQGKQSHMETQKTKKRLCDKNQRNSTEKKLTRERKKQKLF